jgi:ketosteroid isomerase-like protein
VSERVQNMRALLEAWNEVGMGLLETPRFAEFLEAEVDPKVEVRVIGNPMLPGTFRGHEGYRRVVREWNEMWDEITYEVGEVRESEDAIAAALRIRGRGAGSGVDTDSVWGWLFRYRDSKMVLWEIYRNVDQAFAGLGDA